jgi:tetratricopeptide (TPR) repeat protein
MLPVAFLVFDAVALLSLSEQLTCPIAKHGCQPAVDLSAGQVLAIASQLVKDNKLDEAIRVLKIVTQDKNPDLRAEARVRIARLLASSGDYQGAAVWYRKLLDEKPNAQPVRIELAVVLGKMGDISAARRELRQAQAGGLPPEVAQVVNQYATALRSMKPWGGSFELALAPDSNINRATDARTLDTVIAPLNLSKDARQRSGLGLKGSGQVYLRANLGKNVTFVPRLSGQGAFYRTRQFNDVSGSALLGLEWRSKADRITPSAGYTWRWYGDKLYVQTQSLSLDWLHPIRDRAQLDTNIGVNRARYIQNALQDGMIYTGSVTYEQALTTRSGGSIIISANRQTARDPGYASASGGLGLVYWHDFGKVTLFGTMTASRLEGDKRLFLFPDRRQEWYARGGVGAVIRRVQIAGFSPVVRVTYERNWSTVGIYDYRRVSTDFGVTRAF